MESQGNRSSLCFYFLVPVARFESNEIVNTNLLFCGDNIYFVQVVLHNLDGESLISNLSLLQKIFPFSEDRHISDLALIEHNSVVVQF